MLDPGDARNLITFRLENPPTPPAFTAVRLPDHRRAYLEYQGEVSGGRGRVDRVASGVVESLSEEAEGQLNVVVVFGADRQAWRGRAVAESWRFERAQE